MAETTLKKELMQHLSSCRGRQIMTQVLCHPPHGPVCKKWEKDNSFFLAPSDTLCVGWTL